MLELYKETQAIHSTISSLELLGPKCLLQVPFVFFELPSPSETELAAYEVIDQGANTTRARLGLC